MFRRNPKASVAAVLNRLGGQPRHVVSASRGLVLNPTLRGDRLYDLGEYVTRCPHLRCMVLYDVAHPDRLYFPDLHCNREPRRNRDAALSVATMGWWRSRDCTQSACVALGFAGIFVPQRVTTPRALMKWLQENTDGEWHGLNQDDSADADAAPDHGGAARHA